jgi:hypothetical protein
MGWAACWGGMGGGEAWGGGGRGWKGGNEEGGRAHMGGRHLTLTLTLTLTRVGGRVLAPGAAARA